MIIFLQCVTQINNVRKGARGLIKLLLARTTFFGKRYYVKVLVKIIHTLLYASTGGVLILPLLSLRKLISCGIVC